MTAFLSQTLVPTLFNMSLTASIVILCVLVARLILKRAPKVFSYALWAVVLFRLLCPVSLSSGFSLLGALDAPARQASPVVSTVTYVQPQQPVAVLPQVEPLPVEQEGIDTGPATPVTPEQTAAPVDWTAVAAWVWLAGAVGLAGYSLIALLRLRRRLVGALRLRDNIYLADHIATPFVLGLVRPRIYLPSTLTEGELGYIIRHEQYHIRHGDHIVKVFAFAALCLHWFNPLVWAAFVLAGKDMEMRCDEAVVKQLGEGVRADYSASLLALATGRPTIAGIPLAFGEGDPKGRIRNLLRWKRPKLWLSVVAGVACVAVIAACAANPAGQESPNPTASNMTGQYAGMEDFARQTMENAKKVTYYTPSGEAATAQVTGTKLAWLDKQGELEGLAPEGTLEAWTFSYLVQLDVPTEEVALVGGMYEEDGWFDLEGQGATILWLCATPTAAMIFSMTSRSTTIWISTAIATAMRRPFTTGMSLTRVWICPVMWRSGATVSPIPGSTRATCRSTAMMGTAGISMSRCRAGQCGRTGPTGITGSGGRSTATALSI